MSTVAGNLRVILADIKLAHSIFALPFAVIGLLLGTRGQPPTLELAFKILLAMIFARSAAMAFNRLADQGFDASNPRTQGRSLPSGRVSTRAMVTFLVANLVGFLIVAASLSRLCLLLAPLVLAVLCSYSLAKRFTAWAHLVLGFALALAPPAAYLAARGSVDTDVGGVLLFALAVLLWVAGFDIIYACQDIDHDRREGLNALPARLGLIKALRIARWLHVCMIAALLAAIFVAGLGTLSLVGVALVIGLLVVEHRLVAGGDLSNVGAAFFTVNGVVSVLFAGFVSADLLAR
ncbi:MAG: 4-hydroxybenzoate octaprenyltransferase [Planctomycetota bacterium]|nr:MAG: 4-hydroxybenzoate octaprenyltransferase [Planctomycetota bacterium]